MVRSICDEADVRKDNNTSSQTMLGAHCLGKNTEDCSREGVNCGEEAGVIRDYYNSHFPVVLPGSYEM